MSAEREQQVPAHSTAASADHGRRQRPARVLPRWAAAVRGVLLSYLVVCTGIAMFQNHLLYFPERSTLPGVLGKRLSSWPAGSDFRALLAEPHTPARGTAIVFHGNAGHVGHREFYVAPLQRLGLRVLLAEYPGYGPRGGELGESSLVADAAATIALAHQHFGAPLLIVGESLGAAVAAAASARQREAVAALLLITPWDRLENVARHHYPLLPVKWLLRDRYDSVAHLTAFAPPILVVVAGDDRIVPPYLGQALYDSLSGRKHLHVIAGADHNDWFDRLDNQWWQQAIDFLLGER